MAALKENALGKYKGDCYFREVGQSTWINLGAVRAVVGTIDGTSVTDIKSDNRGTIAKFVDLRASISLTMLETFSRDTIKSLFNSTTSTVASSSVNVTNEALGSGLTAGTIKTLAKKNGAGTIVSSIAVSDTSGLLTAGTKYTTGVNSNGETYIVFLQSTTGATTVNYTHTPNASESVVLNVGQNELKNFEVKIEAQLTGKARTITLSSATINSTYSMSFADIVEAGDIAGADLVFDGNTGSTLTYYDENL